MSRKTKVATRAVAIETKHEIFQRLGRGRLRNAIKAIRLVGNLAVYGPHPNEVVFIHEALMSAVEGAMTRFQKETPANLEQQFDLANLQKDATSQE